MSPEQLTDDDWTDRQAFFEEEKLVAEKHLSYSESQLRVCARHIMGQLELEFDEY